MSRVWLYVDFQAFRCWEGLGSCRLEDSGTEACAEYEVIFSSYNLLSKPVRVEIEQHEYQGLTNTGPA
jgi:hypothetical protein